ncbi:MAG: putative transrane protein [Herminiimonas sp.]|nr:putative transrane protein [Herminiimonas sp.]
MNPQENQTLQDFLNQLTQVKGIAKDPQADALIGSAVAQQPDAAYLLVQRALLMEHALNAAKAQIAALQNQLQAAQSSGSSGFLDSANAWGNSPAYASRPAASAMAPNSPMPSMQAPVMQSPAPSTAPGFLSGRAGGMLGNIAATAAGVAGGAFLFQGIENLMGHHSGSGFFNQPGMAPLAAPVENTTVNNYFEGDTATDESSVADNTSDDNLFDDTGADDGSSFI